MNELRRLYNIVMLLFIRLEVSTAETMKNVLFWDMKLSSYLIGDTLRLRYIAQPVNAM
jgi:hypothetical protein